MTILVRVQLVIMVIRVVSVIHVVIAIRVMRMIRPTRVIRVKHVIQAIRMIRVIRVIRSTELTIVMNITRGKEEGADAQDTRCGQRTRCGQASPAPRGVVGPNDSVVMLNAPIARQGAAGLVVDIVHEGHVARPAALDGP